MTYFSDADFATTAVHEREVVLGDGSAHALYFRELTNVELRRFGEWRLSSDVDVRAAADARLVSIGLVSPDGDAVLTFEQAAQLKLGVLKRVTETLLEVNGYDRQGREVAGAGEGKTSPSAASNGSGTS